MKLYTEREITESLESMGLELMVNEFFQMSEPIEIPSDEDIDAHLEKTHTKAVNPPNVYYKTGFEKGAKWMKEQILQPNL